MNRFAELILWCLVLPVVFFPTIAIAILIKFSSRGPVLYWSDRVGRDGKIFRMPKFRSMLVGTPQVATHLLDDPGYWLTPIGSFLRRSSFDELPQLWSVLLGDMSFVGPRPALFNQHDLISLRQLNGVIALRPGITGWAQVNGRDSISTAEKVALDLEYLKTRNWIVDVKIMFITILRVCRRSGIKH